MKIILTSLGVAATLLAVPAHAAEAAMTAGDLKELCAGSDHVSRLSIAAGKGSKPCIPEGVSAEQLEETVKSRLGKELSLSPARGTADAAPFLASTLAEAFPCAGSKAAAQH